MPRSSLTPRQSRSFTKRRRKRGIWKAVFIVIGILLFVFLISGLTRLQAFEITEVNVYGAVPEEVPEIQGIVQNDIQGSYFGMFSKSDIMLYPRNAVARAVAALDPHIQTVAVRSEGLHTIGVTVSERSPAALACASLPDWDGNTLQFDPSEPCYLTDQSGFIYAAASTSDMDDNRYYIPDLADTGSPIIGMSAASSTLFSQWQSLYDGAAVDGIHIHAILVKGGGEYELYADNPTVGSSAATSTGTVVIYMNSSEPLSLALSNLIAFWTATVEQAKEQGTSLDFQYIDLRYGSNVYYRLSP